MRRADFLPIDCYNFDVGRRIAQRRIALSRHAVGRRREIRISRERVLIRGIGPVSMLLSTIAASQV
jgi:hypothetical protein